MMERNAVIALDSPHSFRYTLLLSSAKTTEGFSMRLFAAGPIRFSLCLIALVAVLAATVARGDDFQLDPEQIKAALHTTKQEEEGFIDRTVAMVKSGKLPRELFVSCFIWARKKPRHKFQYFKAALTTRAAAVGINL
jgi:hypothetical protein